MEFRKVANSVPSTSMDAPELRRQLSKRYTTGTPSSTRYWARLPNVSTELVDTGQALPLLYPVSHPFSNTTGFRVEPDGTVTIGFTVKVSVLRRCSPAALTAETSTVYRPGLTRGEAPNTIRPVRSGAIANPSAL